MTSWRMKILSKLIDTHVNYSTLHLYTSSCIVVLCRGTLLKYLANNYEHKKTEPSLLLVIVHHAVNSWTSSQTYDHLRA